MKNYKESAEEVINNKDKQDELIQKLLLVISEWWYTWVIIFCWNYLLWVNNRDECIACVPETFIENWNIIDNDSFNLCQKMSTEKFDTSFSFFSLKIWLELFSKINIQKQLLLSADDKYIDWTKAKDYFRLWYKAIPHVYRDILEKYLDGTKWSKERLRKAISELSQNWFTKKNEFILSERSLVKWFENNKDRNINSYVNYRENLWSGWSSCSLEIFHLLTLVNQRKTKIFKETKLNDKIAMIMFIPDACVSSAMQWWLAVSKADENFEVINVTQTTTAEDGVIMITKITKEWVFRI